MNNRQMKHFYEGIEIHGEGSPLLFFHPPGMGRKVFREQLPLKNDFQLIFFDLYGHGDNCKEEGKPSIQTFARQGLEILNELNIQNAYIIGYSAGSCIAQEFALNYPDKTKGVILIGGYPKVDSYILRYEHLLGMYFVKHYPRFLSKVISLSHTSDPEFKLELESHMNKSNIEIWYAFYELSLHYYCTDRLYKLDSPLYLIYGSRDAVNQHYHEYNKVNDVKTALIDRAGHQLPTRNSQEVNQIIKYFIQNHK